jgi:hypothetical protein
MNASNQSNSTGEARDTSQHPILVTGAHRSGTTWVGKMLSASGEAGYISEPLNVLHRPGVLNANVNHWYTYICPENERQYLPALEHTLAFRYHLWAELRSLRSRKDTLRMGRDWSGFLRGKILQRRPLIKDPFAVLSSEWFAHRLGCRVVITVRHPAAFASSLKRLNWPFDFSNLLEQPYLMRDYLEPYRHEMLSIHKNDIIGGAGLLWRIIYDQVAQFRKTHPQFIIVRHEDLSREPLPGFQSLYESLGMVFTHRARVRIQNASDAENPKEVSKNSIYDVQLNSKANLQNWKKRLSQDEIDRLRRDCEQSAGAFYSPGDWE